MILYTLRCTDGHVFDAWFGSSSAYDTQRAAGHVACAVCDSREVEKAPMAPALGAAERPSGGQLSRPANPREAMLARLREKIETSSDYVGREFAAEARRIHEGDADARPIWGEASGQEARELVRDGVPIAPVPWMRRRNG